MNMPRFLVVDDHPLMRGAILHQLERSGLGHAEQACNLSNALKRLAAGPPVDLVLLDLILPDTSAAEGLETLRAHHPSLKVVVTSAHADAPLIERCLQAGARGFLPKTAPEDYLPTAVRTALAGGVYLPRELEQPSRASHGGLLRQIGLTDRQTDVLKLMLRGMPNKLIGRHLHLAEGTVKVHVSGVFRALGVRSRTQAVLAANRLGLRLPD
jgi:DNA-binding NarL/FixJ family response regulator